MRTVAILPGGAMAVTACASNPPPPPPAPPAAAVDPNNPLFAPGFLAPLKGASFTKRATNRRHLGGRHRID